MALSPTGAPGHPLTIHEITRFSRHILLPQVGIEGQERLLAAKVCVIGAGGLGSATLTYLAAAGVGTIGIVDDDRVEISNLQRPVIHGDADVGRLKTESAAESMSRHRCAMPGWKTAAASTSSSRRSPSMGHRSRSANFPSG